MDNQNFVRRSGICVSSTRSTRTVRRSILAALALLLGASFASAQTGRFYTLNPCRVFAPGTRRGHTRSGARRDTERQFTIAGTCGNPDERGVRAVN